MHRIFRMALAVGVAVTAVIAQETRGTIVGRVTDPSGALIPNADVQVANKAMGTTVALKTNADGIYTAPLLLPG
ncbi:MAG TPA: carboxypeptidase-like regulatory domain-containing protein, partial [Bryobacteraceae bacterium]|nr:carboxypeptidase-like regulatory domain-containing protein [Bryobacteraceae bacterium]